ncbi:MAG: HAD family phosphatase, partial [Planctomycetaceae bacterium]|nr:HAD family phosphatase [Planctomycetaceae bacterium]
MLLAERLAIPDDTSAILWDMDGVLLDTLSQDDALCNQLLHAIVDSGATVDRATIRRFFPFDLPEFWRRILEAIAPSSERGRQDELIPKLVGAHEAARESASVALNPGIEAVLRAAREVGLKLAVVSNNPTAQVREMLRRHHNLLPRFDEVIGNDLQRVAKKPAPDSYLFAARALDVPARRCVVIEDSLLGVQAGRAAGCYVVGVATGSASFEDLEASPSVDRTYLSFETNRVAMTPGLVTKKSILTPNDFVSHMIEHLAWRVGCSIDLRWNNADWSALGRALGEVMRTFPRSRDSTAVLGMIDDGSAEVRLEANAPGRLSLKGVGGVDLDWFLGLRCEQMSSGKPLVEILGGIADAVPVHLDVTVCSVEDPHHSWEGVFRSVGSAFLRLMVERSDRPSGEDGPEPDEPV